MAMAVFSARRAAVMLAVGIAGFGALAGRVAYLQSYGREKTIRQAERQQHREQVLPARRGCIYDRNGLLLAGTVQSRVMFVDAKFMREEFTRAATEELARRAEVARRQAEGKKVATTQPATVTNTAVFPGRYAPWDGVTGTGEEEIKTGVERAMRKAVGEIAELIRRDGDELYEQINRRENARYVVLAKRVDDETAGELLKLGIKGLGFGPMPVRAYPMDSLAAHILGGISADGTGIDGLEAKYDRVMQGRNGFLREQKDGRGNPIAVTTDDYVAPVHGQHLVLTIDANIQMIAEQELRASVTEFGAKAGEVVVMDPWTGEVLALANWPKYRPAEYLDKVNEKARLNRALVAPYEPGSTIKPFLVSPWLEQGLVRANEVLNTHNGHYVTPYGRGVTDVHEYPQLAVWDVLVKSSNIGMALMGERVKDEQIRGSLARFGFGAPTGIELPGEAGGLLRPLNKWTKYSTESIVQGYELMVTPVQLVRGMSAIANGGRLMRPTIVKGVVEEEGEVREIRLASAKAAELGGVGGRDILQPQTTAQVRQILADVLVRGTGTRARSAVYNIFGKTGTAHLTEPGKRGYSQEKYTSSFVGGAPYEHPRLTIAFIIHEAKKNGKNYFGGTTAAPGAGRVLERSLRYLNVAPSTQLPPPTQIAGLLYNYDEKKYTQWPDNVVKERQKDEGNVAAGGTGPGGTAAVPWANGVGDDDDAPGEATPGGAPADAPAGPETAPLTGADGAVGFGR